jgi:hypothetical protein
MVILRLNDQDGILVWFGAAFTTRVTGRANFQASFSRKIIGRG